jgi:hypothetical protein
MYGQTPPAAPQTLPIELQERVTSSRFLNVAEAWPVYDTVLVCPQFFGQEQNVGGWFQTFATFAGQERHSFFNVRTEATSDLAYCNKQTADTMDFAMEVYSFGCSFFSPGVRALGNDAGEETFWWNNINSQLAHWWEVELPRHCSIEFKVQQDTIIELPCMAASPGYGPVGSGASFDHPLVGRVTPNGENNGDYQPVMNMSVTQGVPTPKNRWPFPDPIGIPRTSTIEAIISVSEVARLYLSQMAGVNLNYVFGGIDGTSAGGPGYTLFPARFGIQVSLYGKRMVQQRAQWHV